MGSRRGFKNFFGHNFNNTFSALKLIIAIIDEISDVGLESIRNYFRFNNATKSSNSQVSLA